MTLPRSLLRAGALVVLVTLTAFTAAAGPSRSAQAPQAVTIRISLTDAGVQIQPNTARVRQGQTLEWQSELPFAVAVQRNSTLFGRTLPPQALRGRQNAPVRAAVASNAPVQERFKYSVAVWDGTNVWVVDPEILVLPGE